MMQVPWSGVMTNHSTSPFAEEMYDKIRDSLNQYEVVINRWPQYSLILENVSYDFLPTVTIKAPSIPSPHPSPTPPPKKKSQRHVCYRSLVLSL